jgi:hypothetical protein
VAGVFWLLAAASFGYLSLVQLGITGYYDVADVASAGANAFAAVTSLMVGSWLIRRPSLLASTASVAFAAIVLAAGSYQLTRGVHDIALAIALTASGLAGSFSLLALGQLGRSTRRGPVAVVDGASESVATPSASEADTSRTGNAGLAAAAPDRVANWSTSLAIAFSAGAAYVVTDVGHTAGRPDFYYLADAFLNGRLWLTAPIHPIDSVVLDAHTYLPFGPLPAVILMPLVALIGPGGASALEPIVNAIMGGTCLALVEILLRRMARLTQRDRNWLVVFFGFSTPLWWLVLNGGVWHEAQILATLLTLVFLIEAFGARRPIVLGLLLGAAFLCRTPIFLAAPLAAWAVSRNNARIKVQLERIGTVAIAAAPALAIFLWYNAARFGSPFESGYGLTVLPPFLDAQRAQGMFSIGHVPMNLDYLLWHLPVFQLSPVFIAPDGYGMSIALTSPAILLAARADWRSPQNLVLAATCLLVLIPSLLYYGGGWYQFGYRYAMDFLPFTIPILANAVERRGLPRWGIALILVGCAVNLSGVLWTYFH